MKKPLDTRPSTPEFPPRSAPDKEEVPASGAGVGYPLSVAQEGIWLSEQMYDDATSYAVAEITTITGALDEEAFVHAAQHVLAVTPATRLRLVGANPPRQLFDAPPPQVRVVDSVDVEAVLATPADPYAGCVSHAIVERSGAESYRWLLRAHHLGLDGYAFSLIAANIARVYRALIGGADPAEYPLDAQPSEGDVAAYLKAIADGPEAQPGPRDVPPPAEPLLVGGAVRSDSMPIPARIAVPDPALLIAAAAVLSSATGRQRRAAVVGMHVMNRQGSLRPTVAATTQNLTPVVVDATPVAGKGLADLAAQAKVAWTQASARQAVRHESIRAQAGLASHEALVDVAVNLVPFNHSYRLGEATAKAAPLHDGPTDGAVVDVRPAAGGGYAATLLTPEELVEEETRRGWATIFAHAWEGLVAAEARDIGEPEEPADGLDRLALGGVELYGGPVLRPADLGDVCALAGAGEWLAGPDARLDPRQAGERVDRLSAALERVGVGVGDRVAIALPRGTWSVLAPLAVWRVGAAFVPVDAAWPAARRAEVLAQADPAAMIDEAFLATIDENHEVLTSRVPAAVPTEAPAYVLFTSGSTGKPKGVVIPRSAIANYISTVRDVHLRPLGRPRVAHVHPCSFDSSFSPLAMYLLGCPLDIAAEDTIATPTELRAFLAARETEFVDISPAVLERVLAGGALPALRGAYVGGDSCPQGLWDTLRDLPLTAANAYGPTENTVDTTLAWVAEYPAPSIGRVLPGQEGRVADRYGRALPAGVPGELHVRGSSLATGYLGQPAATAEAFAGGWYRTGDLVRADASGALTYIGRTDSQLSLRGVRIEPAEVEAALTRLPGVTNAAAIIRDDGAGERLVGYAVTDNHAAFDAVAARNRLRSELPAAFVPSVIVPIAALPLTERGKVDSARLPAPMAGGAARSSARPLTPAERHVALGFAQVLGLDTPPDDPGADFFALGGHSLAAVSLGTTLPGAPGLKDILDNPTVAELAELIEKTETIYYGEPIASVGSTGATRARGVEITDSARSLWLVEQLHGPSHTYNIPVVLNCHLPIERLRPALSATIAAHRVLRRCLPAADDGTPTVREFSAAEINDAVRITDFADPAPIDVTSELPVRAHYEGRGATVLTFHHTAIDGGALPRVLDTFARAYAATGPSAAGEAFPALGGADPLPAPAPTTGTDLDFWREYLAGLPTEITLPCDYPRPATRDGRGGEYVLDLGGEASAAVVGLARRTGSTPFAVIHAALATLLHRCGGGEDIPIGTVYANRVDGSAVACLATTVVTRTSLEGNPTFAEVIARTRGEWLNHAHNCLDDVVAAVGPQRTQGVHPLFQVLLVSQDAPDLQIDLGLGRPVIARVCGTGTAKFDLTVEIIHCADATIALRFEYASDLWRAETVSTFADWLSGILERAAENPSARIGTHPLGAPGERTAVTAPRADFPGVGTLHAAVERALVSYPDRVAITDATGAGAQYTYRQLDADTAGLAAALNARGIGAGDRVAVLAERGYAQVRAIIGVVRAGACYVPLDPAYPTARLRSTFDDADVAAMVIGSRRVLAAHSGLVDAIVGDRGSAEAERAPVSFVDLDGRDVGVGFRADAPAPGAAHCPAPRTVPTEEDPAYVIFTSGSTGRPKGVVIPQSNVPRLFAATEEHFNFGQHDVWTAFHSFAFDFAVWELYGALLYGGRLVLVGADTARSPQEFAGLLADQGVTVLNLTPSAFAQLTLAEAESPSALSLRTVILGGEAMDPNVVSAWFGIHPAGSPEVVNMYGITETTVHVTYQLLDAALLAAGGSAVGEPISDLGLYLLDAYGHPVPEGVVGEIHVSGAGLAAGYLGREELSAQRFVPDGTGVTAGRMYRSGDLAVRRRRDHVLEFRGRSDRQVQLRGFRIELGEVELAAVAAVDEVRWAHARVLDERIVAYVVGPDPATADPIALRHAIADALPVQMAPGAVVAIPEVPLTVNGKLDTAALPAPDIKASAGRAPEGPLESAIAEAFTEVLGLESVSAEDSFFDLGGHSLLAVGLTGLIGELTGHELRVGTVMANPTPELLAQALGGEVSVAVDLQVLLPLRRCPATDLGVVVAIHPAGGLSWCYSGLPRQLPDELPVWGLQARGVLNPDDQPGSLAEIADDYIAQIKSVAPTGPYHIVGWSLGGMVAHVMAARLGKEAGVVALLDAYPSEAEAGVEEPPLEDALSAVLAMAGLDDDEFGGEEPTFEAMAGILTRRHSPMAGLDIATLRAIVATYRNTARILREYAHESYGGEVYFFRAARAGIGPDHDPHEWDAYLDKPMRIIDVDCTHREMTRPGPIAAIGAVVAQAILENARAAGERG